MKSAKQFRVIGAFFLALFVSGSAALAEQTAGNTTWITAAQKGEPEAQYIMGNAYASGMPSLGIEKSPQKAFQWYMKAARQEHARAQYEVAAALILGEGATRNMEAARIWLTRAASNGDTEAREVLAGFPAVMIPADTSATAAKPPVTRQSVPPPPASGGSFGISNVSLDPMAMIEAVISVDVFGNYWPWWLGGLALGLITVGFWVAMKTTLGVSSSYDRIVRWREDRDLVKAAALMQETPGGVLESAMMAATMEQFGDDVPEELLVANGATATAILPVSTGAVRIPWPAHVTFLAATVAGGFLAAFASGSFEIQMDMGKTFERFFGNGILMWAVLLLGGFLIGFGTRMGGGCTSGHGLSGCSRLQPGSLLGTASFFGTAIAVSLAMEMFL